jgi:hypothetical protein
LAARGIVVDGKLFDETLAKHKISPYKFSILAEVSYPTVVRLIYDERTAGKGIRDKIAAGLKSLGESEELILRIAPEVATGQMFSLRKVPDNLANQIRESCRLLRLPNRDVLIRPFVISYPWLPTEVAEAVKTYSGRNRLALGDFLAAEGQVNETLPALAVQGGYTALSIAGVPRQWYMVWKTAIARSDKYTNDVIADMYQSTHPYVPLAVVKAAEKHATDEGMALSVWVGHMLGKEPWS